MVHYYQLDRHFFLLHEGSDAIPRSYSISALSAAPDHSVCARLANACSLLVWDGEPGGLDRTDRGGSAANRSAVHSCAARSHGSTTYARTANRCTNAIDGSCESRV